VHKKYFLFSAVYEFFCCPQNPIGVPLYVYSDKTSIKVCFNEKSGIKAWESAPNESQRIQKFLYNLLKTPSKLRVYWKFSEGPRYFLIKNSQPFPKVISKDQTLNEILTSKYKHSLLDYPYAGQIFKSSFNMFMPQKSELMSKKRLIKKKFSESIKQDMFKCKATQENVFTVIPENIDAEITEMMDNIISLINNVIGRIDKKVVTDLLVDFMQDEGGKWWFLRIKAHKFDYLPTKVPSFLGLKVKKSILNLEFSRGFYDSLTCLKGKKVQEDRNSLSMENFHRRLESIEKKIKDLRQKNSKVPQNSLKKSNLLKNLLEKQAPQTEVLISTSQTHSKAFSMNNFLTLNS
jgi:hypothetical protein